MVRYIQVLLGLALASAPFYCVADEVAEEQRVVVKEQAMLFKVFNLIYLPSSDIKSLPQVRVFGPDGTCLGAIALDSSARGTLAERSNELVGRPQNNCNMHIGNDMRSEPSLEGGPGKYVGQLLMFEMGFCTACKEMEAELRGMAARDTDMGEWVLIKVSADEAFTPDTSGAGGE